MTTTAVRCPSGPCDSTGNVLAGWPPSKLMAFPAASTSSCQPNNHHSQSLADGILLIVEASIGRTGHLWLGSFGGYKDSLDSQKGQSQFGEHSQLGNSSRKGHIKCLHTKAPSNLYAISTTSMHRECDSLPHGGQGHVPHAQPGPKPQTRYLEPSSALSIPETCSVSEASPEASSAWQWTYDHEYSAVEVLGLEKYVMTDLPVGTGNCQDQSG